MKKTCDATTSKGEKCRLPAGYQTTHKGVGRCKFHDGRDYVEKYEKQSKTDIHLEPSERVDNIRDALNRLSQTLQTQSKTVNDIHIEQSESQPEKYKMEPSKRVDEIIDGLRELSLTNLEQSKIVNDIEQSKLKLKQNKDLCVIIFILLLLFGLVFISILSSYVKGPFSIIIYVATLVGFRFFAHIKGYWKFLTPEEREARRIKWEAEKEAHRSTWGGPIKSAHIIRMERGLRTGLGNRRPYPHGRRTKKY